MFDDFFEEVFCDIEDKVISPPEQNSLIYILFTEGHLVHFAGCIC